MKQIQIQKRKVRRPDVDEPERDYGDPEVRAAKRAAAKAAEKASRS